MRSDRIKTNMAPNSPLVTSENTGGRARGKLRLVYIGQFENFAPDCLRSMPSQPYYAKLPKVRNRE